MTPAVADHRQLLSPPAMYYNGFFLLFSLADLFTPALKASMFRISAWVGNGVCFWVCTFYCFLSVYIEKSLAFLGLLTTTLVLQCLVLYP
jgi:hypothetical protein